jgi:hypothetical protein
MDVQLYPAASSFVYDVLKRQMLGYISREPATGGGSQESKRNRLPGRSLDQFRPKLPVPDLVLAQLPIHVTMRTCSERRGNPSRVVEHRSLIN